MADQEARLIVSLVDKATSGIVALGGAIAGITAFLVSSTKAYMESEEAVNRLNTALKSQGVYSQKTSEDLQQFASQLQRITTFSDESIIETESLLTTFGLAGQQLKDTTKAALDLSKGLGIDLRTATLILGKAALGETGTLSRYGIVIDESIPKSQRLDAVLYQLNQRFGGAAQAAVQTMAGRIQNLANRFDDFKERIGKAVVPVLENLATSIDYILTKIEKWTKTEEESGVKTNEVIQSIIDKKRELIITSTEEGTFNEEITQKRLESLDALLAKERERVGNKSIVDAQEQAQTRTHLNFIKGQEKISQEERKKQMVAFLNFVSSAQSSHIRGIAALGKAAAISQATIDTFAAANSAYKALAGIPIIGPALGAAAAAAAIAAGLANVGKIAGVKGFAEGGIVNPIGGGTIARIAEAGKPEAVIPLEDDRSKELLQETLGGGSIVINVGTLIADDVSLREFTRRIDRELFALNRNKQSVALG